MTGLEFQRIREGLGLSVVDMAIALGYGGNRNTLATRVRRWERDAKPIPTKVASATRRLFEGATHANL